MTPKDLITAVLKNQKTERKAVFNPVSSATVVQMEIMDSFFPEAHFDAKKMFELSRASYEVLGYDAIMPVFSVVIEAFANGCEVDWGCPAFLLLCLYSLFFLLSHKPCGCPFIINFKHQ
jgi:uroporphyrinogen-III decarboxylase